MHGERFFISRRAPPRGGVELGVPSWGTMLIILNDAPAPITWADFLRLEYEAPTPAQAADLADTTDAAGALIGLLPAVERWVVAQTLLEGRSLREVAHGLGLTYQRVQQLREAAMKRLRGSRKARQILWELS